MSHPPHPLRNTPLRPNGLNGTAEVFGAFLRLGLTSFGGPVAHLGYFRDEFVTRRRWLEDAAYGELIALCQFLPGPASSQAGFAIGLLRAGPLGALAAWAAFTLPSAAVLVALALGLGAWGGPAALGALAGLKLVAVAVVAQAVIGMARSLCPNTPRATIAVAALGVLAVAPAGPAMLAAIVAGGVAGAVLGRGLAWQGFGPPSSTALPSMGISRGAALGALGLFAVGLVGLPLIAADSPALGLAAAFYSAGAVVFGGGHVVLPLLEAGVVDTGMVARDAFVAGYGAAQAVPGPLFTVAAYLGAVAGPGGVAGAIGMAALALGAIFLPGLLLLVGVLPFWSVLRTQPVAQAALQGANAAVVGILGAALYSPVFTSAIRGIGDLFIALAVFILIDRWRSPVWAVVGCAALVGSLRALYGQA
jgi:chromate transporter